MGPYQTIAEALQMRYFLSSNGNTTWYADRDSPDMLLIHGETKIAGRITPADEVTFFLNDRWLESDYNCAAILRHVGLTEARQERPTNKQAFWKFVTGHELVIGDTFVHGVVQPLPLDVTPHPNNLALRLVIPDQFVPKELPKVPRAEIAKIRKHVEEQFKLALVQRRLLNQSVNRRSCPFDPDPTTETHQIHAAVHGDLLKRAQFMTGTNQVFWKHISVMYSSPATLIDSCRSALYDAAGVRSVS